MVSREYVWMEIEGLKWCICVAMMSWRSLLTRHHKEPNILTEISKIFHFNFASGNHTCSIRYPAYKLHVLHSELRPVTHT